MDKDRIEGGARQAMGTAKSTVGRIVGDAQTEAGGIYDQAVGAAQNIYGQAKDAAGTGADQMSRVANNAYGQARDVAGKGAEAVAGQVRESPLSSVLAVGAVGFVLGWMMRGRN